MKMGLVALALALSNVVIPPAEPVPAVPFDYAPGEVCPFGMHVDFPVNEQMARTVIGPDGTPRYATITGALVASYTNLQTGETVERDLDQDGRAFIVYQPDGGQRIVAFGGLGAGFRATDTPSSAYLVFNGVTVLDVTAENEKTLIAQSGSVEDLCQTLAP